MIFCCLGHTKNPHDDDDDDDDDHDEWCVIPNLKFHMQICNLHFGVFGVVCLTLGLGRKKHSPQYFMGEGGSSLLPGSMSLSLSSVPFA